MLDIKWMTENLETVKTALKNRGIVGANDHAPLLDNIVALNEQRKKLQFEFDQLRAAQNSKSKDLGIYKKEGRDSSALMTELQEMSKHVKDLGTRQNEIEDALKNASLYIPNVPHASVPVGTSAEDNQEIHKWGSIRNFDFQPKEHWELGEKLGFFDFERAAKIAGARFSLSRGALAKLERVLINFMLDVHTQNHGYEEVLPPFLVNSNSLLGTGNLPKFEEDLFKTTAGYYLIPTAEVPVTNIFNNEILPAAELPKYFCAYTPCFRSEAGSAGKDTKGLIRQHQFNKVELVKITRPENSFEEHEKLTRHAEVILEKLNLPYRRVLLCTADMGFGSAKTYDLEVWLPGQNAYREISSCSNFETFQARRMNTRFKDENGKLQFVHTLNGSGLAVGRTLVAILENYQQADGSIMVPEALKSAMGTDVIR